MSSVVFLLLFFSSINAALPPEQVHLALGSDPSQMSVSWVTQVGEQLGNGESTAEYGVSVFKLNMAAIGINKTFYDQGPNKRNFTIHMAAMTGLVPATRYYYHVGNAEDGWSPVYSFKSSQSVGSSEPFTMAIYGDMGSTNAQALTLVESEIVNETVDYVLHVGDFAYDMYVSDGKVGDDFMKQIVPVAAYVPYMVCLGNHENHYNFLHYTMRFINQPSNSGVLPSSVGSEVAGLPNNWFFSYDVGLVHFVAFSTEIYFDYKEMVPVQWEWLQQDLERVNKRRKVTPWVVLYGHRSVYCSCDSDCDDAATLVRDGLNGKYGIEELNYNYGVDLFINGHEHDYERNYAVYKSQHMGGNGSMVMNPRASVYIITGSAGCRENHEPFTRHQPTYSAVRFNTYGYSKMTVLNSTHMYWEQIQTDNGQSADDMGKQIDKMWLIADEHGPFQKSDA